MVTVTTGITQLTDEGPIYRGRPGHRPGHPLALRAGGRVAVGHRERRAPVPPRHGLAEATKGRPVPPTGRRSSSADLPDLGPSDRIRWAVVMAGALDPLRADLRPEAVTRTARRLTRLDGRRPGRGNARHSRSAAQGRLPPPGRWGRMTGRDLVGSMAERLASALSPDPTAGLIRAVNAAMVLMADHELATSTMAVRIAASTRADVYDAVLAGLGTIAGPLHGGASQLAYSLLLDAERDGAERALDDTLRWQRVLPGFGHTVYKHGDARFSVLLELFEQLATPDQVDTVHRLIEVAAAHAIPLPNVDLGMAAIAWSTGMAADAGRTLFTVARVAGWVAHYLEELEERPLRYRARAVYATPGRH